MHKEKVIIIGGGPAGIACAIQLKRYGIDPLLFERDQIGGLVRNAWRLDNYPGYPEGISGPGLVEKLRAHITRFNIRNSRLEIRDSRFAEGKFYLEAGTQQFSCEYLVIATGTKAIYTGEGYTEVYPLRQVKDKRIAIIGAGDAAFDYAMTLSPRNTIHIHNRGKKIKCIPALLEIALKQDNISYFENSSPSGSYDYTIFATGREPDMGCMSEELLKIRHELEQQGLLCVIGDVKNGMVRQTSVATGDGIRAAMTIIDRIKADEGNQQNAGT